MRSPLKIIVSIYLAVVIINEVKVWAGTELKTFDPTSIQELYSANALMAVNSPVTLQISALSTVLSSPHRPRILEQDFYRTFSDLITLLYREGLDLSTWFQSSHFVYLDGILKDKEKREMIRIFNIIRARILIGERNLRNILLDAGNSFLIAKVAHIDHVIQHLKAQHKDVIRFALSKHEIEAHQKYGDLPYSYHLRKVRSVLKRFGFGPKDSIVGLKLGSAAWLHDVIEDTDVTYDQIAELFGVEIADIVRGVTKFSLDQGNKTGHEQMAHDELIRRTYERARQVQGARILKLADRIANVENGLADLFNGRPTKVHKYFAEWPIFRELLFVEGDADEMWLHLE